MRLCSNKSSYHSSIIWSLSSFTVWPLQFSICALGILTHSILRSAPIIPAKKTCSLGNSVIINYVGIPGAHRIIIWLYFNILASSLKIGEYFLQHQFSLDPTRIVIHTIILLKHNSVGMMMHICYGIVGQSHTKSMSFLWLWAHNDKALSSNPSCAVLFLCVNTLHNCTVWVQFPDIWEF